MLLLAPPGAGKGTQGLALAAHYGIRHISSGDLLRAEIAAGREPGLRARTYLDAGDLVPDELLFELLTPQIASAARAGGYVLDGFPRTLAQSRAAAVAAERLGIGLQAVVVLQVADDVLVRRLLARSRGADDAPGTVRHRIEVYHRETEPLVASYRERGLLHEVDGDQPPAAVTAAIVRALDG